MSAFYRRLFDRRVEFLALLLLAGFAWEAKAGVQVMKEVPYLGAGKPEALDLYLPERAAADPETPAVIWIHGGGWNSGSKSEARAIRICTTLAESGYVCASVEYRLGTGAWPTNLYDCKNAVRFLRKNAARFHIDPDRIAVMGGSAGGHLALMVGFTSGEAALEPTEPYAGVSDAVCAIGDFYGPADLLTRQKPTEQGVLSGKLIDGLNEARVFGGTREAAPGLWRLASPVSHVTPQSPPVFIAQGLADPLVDYEQSKELDRVLTQNGVTHDTIFLQGIGHTFDLTTWNKKPLPLDLRPLLLDFLHKHLGIPAHGTSVSPTADSPRTSVELDDGWKFLALDDPKASSMDFDDRSWTSVSVPHTWNAMDGEDGGNDYRRGVSWYRRHLKPANELEGKRLYLQFDGVSLGATVYVNGQKLGSHMGGFARFCFDVTGVLRVGADNVIAVRVDNGALGIAPVSADFTFFGGIYRPVHLLATHAVQISTTDYASPGVYLDQERVSREEAEIGIRAEVESHAVGDAPVTVVAHLLDRDLREVQSAEATVNLASNLRKEVRIPMVIRSPHLWNGRADPYVYAVAVEVRKGGILEDKVTQPLGLRYFRVDPSAGFFLNGQPLDLHGVSRHQDRINKGWAINAADEAEDFTLLNELGCTAVRVSHYPQADTWYQRFDRAGIVAWAEIPFVNEALPTPEFRDNLVLQMRELIRQNYNHPSICFWGVGNETKDTDKVVTADSLIAMLAKVVRSEDPRRLSTYASNSKEADPRNWHTDVMDFNRYMGWYDGASSDWPAWLDQIHAKHPNAPFGISEYGAGGSVIQHEEHPSKPKPVGPFHPEEYQAEVHEAAWQAFETRPYLWSKFVWTLADFASDRRHEGDHAGRNDKGLVTYDRRTRKDAYGWYQANWSSLPVVWLTGRRFVERADAASDVKVYSNATEVELFVNGSSLGVCSSNSRIFKWPGVKLEQGVNRISAVAHFGNVAITDACTWTLKPKT